MTQDMVKMMSQDKMIGKREILSSSPSPWFSRFLRAMLLLLMMTLGVGEMLGQDTDYSGKYYIASDAIVSNKSTYDENTPANNYYLCPTDGWCYYMPDDKYSDDGNAYPNPFLTTYKWRDGVNDNKVIWIIEKCPNSNYSNYYYIKQHIEGNKYKYLMLNGKISGTSNNGKNRMRVHLEERVEDTDNPTTNALFSITLASSSSAAAGNVTSLANEKSVIITPKNTENEDSKCKYLVVNGGNANYLTGQSAKSDGPGTSNEKYKWTGGIIGLYYDENGKQDANAPFYLENKPTISFSDQNKVRITYFDYVDNEVEIRYTTNGDTPTASSTLYEGEFDPPAGTTMIKAIAIESEKESDVTTFTPPVFLGSTHQYIIQSKNCKFYNMIPNVSVDNNTKYVSALNVPCSTMAWHFEYAEEGYYYIVDTNGWYMYYTTTDNTNKYIYLKSNKEESDGYKFQIASHANGGYNIIPKGQTKAIYKNNYGNNDAGLTPVKFDGTITNDVARWDLIPYSTTNLPMWEDAPFTVSTDEETYYYNIVSVSQPTKPLILNNSGLIKSEIVPTSDYDERKAMWVIKRVGQDTGGLLEYYTFQNAYTGDLLYYNGSGREIAKNASPGVLQNGMPATEGVDATWAHFVIVQTVSGYNIIPRVLVDNTKAITKNSTHEAFNCINRASGNDWTGTYYDIDNGSRWTFTKVDNVKCMEPVFTEEANGDITITTVTNAAKILYTINDVNNPDASSTEYTTKENTSAQKVIKAIAIMGNDASTASNVVTLLNKPDITLAAGPYTYKGTAWEPAITKVSITLSGTEIEADASAYSVTSASYTNNINAGTDAATVTLTDASATDLWCILNASTNFSIDKALLTITPTAGQSKVYGDDDPTLEYSSSIATTSGLYDTDAFDGALGRDEGENVGNYAINQGTLKVTRESTDVSANYDITIADESFTITARPITISGITASEKTYDGNTAATLVYTGVTYGNIKDGDVLNVTATGTFDNKNAGTGKAVTISGLTLGGDDVSNYELATSGQQDEAKADINPKPFTITNIGLTASGKTYDGTTAANFIDYSNATIDGIIVGDDLTIDSATGTFDNKNVGTSKTVTITGFTFGGTDAANYTYNGGDLTATADITPASVTVTAENKTKGYGDADPELTWTVDGLQGADTKDVLTVSMSRTEGEDVGTTITITPSGHTEQGNYTVSYVTGTLTITAKAIGDGTTPAEGIDIDITYDGTDYTVTVKQGENELQQGGDKAYTWTGADGSTDTYVVTITGQGNYNNSAKATYIKQTFYDTTPDQVLTTETTAAVYCATQNLKVNDTFEAYYVTKLENNTLTITKVEAGEGENKKNYIPEGQPVLLISETNPAPKGFTLKPYTGTDLVTIPTTGEGANLLKVVPDEGGRAVNLEEVYIFSMGEFVLNKAGTMSKGKFYLENPDYNTSAHSRSILSITSGDVTGINTFQLSDTDSQIPDIWYTIGGQKLLKKPTRKGLYLQNGKKVVIK